MSYMCVDCASKNTVECLSCLGGEKKSTPVVTNYDRIISMMPEELAEWIASIIDCCNCPKPVNGCTESEEACAAAWAAWLKKEVSDGN